MKSAHFAAAGIAAMAALGTIFLASASPVAIAAGGVFIAAPANGAAMISPVPIAATTNIPSPQYMKIWIDGQAVALAMRAANISYNAPLAPGNHRITVQAYNGTLYSNTSNITIVPAADPGTTVIGQIQSQSGWQTCGACGNSGGTGIAPSHSMTPGIASPSVSGSSARFAVNGNGHPYTNAYWYVQRFAGAPARPANYLSYSFDLYIPSTGSTNIQAIEFEAQQGAAGKTYNFAWQADYADNAWRTFDYANRQWLAAPVPFEKFSTNTWHHIETVYHVGSDGYGYHDGLIIDGVPYLNLNIRHAPVAAANNYLSNAIQLDTRSNGGAYSVYVDNMMLQYQD